MNCQVCRNEIEELEMDEHLSDAARAHVRACLPCGAFYNERLSLRKLVGSLEPVSAPSDFEFRLRARLASGERAGNHRSSWRTFIASAPAIGLAASFALLVAAVVIYKQFSVQPAVTQPAAVAELKSEQKPEPAVPQPMATNSEGSFDIAGAKREEKAGLIESVGSAPRPRLAENGNSAVRRPRQIDTTNVRIVSHDEAARPAPQIRPTSGSQLVSTSGNPLVELSVRSSSQAVRVFIDDVSGSRRSVTLEPVVFGSQDFTGRSVSHTSTPQGIW